MEVRNMKESNEERKRMQRMKWLLHTSCMSVLWTILSFQNGSFMGVEAFAFPQPLSHATRFHHRVSDNNNNNNNNKWNLRMSSSEEAEVEAPSDVESQPFRPSSSSSTAATSTKAGIGEWEEMHGNYLLRPQTATGEPEQQPRALIHFLGGALVGAAPDLSYRYLLEKLSRRGFLIVATPYKLSFDYIRTCDDIIGRFERIAPDLARQYGAVPVVGAGHSCGALLQLLITSLFPDTPRAANALLSYNNKPVKEAVPFFEEVVAPFFVSIAGERSVTGTAGNGTVTGDDGGADNDADGGGTAGASCFGALPSSTTALNYALELGRIAIDGEVPSDQLLSDILKFATPPGLPSTLTPDKVEIPKTLRETLQKTIVEPIAKAQTEAGISPLLYQTIDVLEQIPLLIDEVADGAREFNPPRKSVQAAARRAYRARRTLLVQYDDDGLDESEELESLLREAETVMRMKRPMVSFDIERTVLEGFHATPCLAPPLDLASKAEDILGGDDAKDKLLYKGADATVEELVRWMEEGQL